MSSALAAASLILKPEGYSEGTLESLKPIDRSGDFTFTRGSNLSATRVNSAGLIEKGRENLLLYSNSFNNWINSNTIETSGQSGYDGSSDAWLLEKSAASAFIYRSFSGSGVYSLSVYAKADTLNSIFLLVLASGGNGNAYFNLSTGVVDAFGNNAFDAQIEDVGGGWYRCSLIGSYTSISQVRIYPANNEALGDTSGSIYIQDAQLEVGMVATDYIETGASTVKAGILENTPRLDYSGGATEPSLLLEPSRTNLVTQSEYFGDTTWANTYTLTPNYTISPDGYKNAYRVQVGTINGNLRQQISVNSSTNYVFSFYAKRGSATEMKYRVFDFTNSGDIVTKTSYYSQTSSSNWVRIEVPFTTAATTASVGVYIDSDGQGNGDFYVFGAQLEEDSYPTSYIPTYGSSETRSAEILDRGADFAYTGAYTLFMEFELTKDAVYFLTNTSLAYRLFFEKDDAYFKLGSSIVVFQNMFDWEANLGTNIKMAFTKSGTTASMFVNGTKYTPSTNTLSTGNEVLNWRYLNYTTTADRQEQAYIKQLLEFEQALSDAELATLTTL